MLSDLERMWIFTPRVKQTSQGQKLYNRFKYERTKCTTGVPSVRLLSSPLSSSYFFFFFLTEHHLPNNLKLRAALVQFECAICLSSVNLSRFCSPSMTENAEFADNEYVPFQRKNTENIWIPQQSLNYGTCFCSLQRETTLHKHRIAELENRASRTVLRTDASHEARTCC